MNIDKDLPTSFGRHIQHNYVNKPNKKWYKNKNYIYF